MMREWRRVYRLRGLTPFGVLLVVALAVLVLADLAAERWGSAARQRDALEQRVARMRATLERGRQIESALEAARGRLASLESRMVVAPDAASAGELLGRATEKWLGSTGATGKGMRLIDNGERTAPRTAVAEISARMSPKQLLRILGEWRDAPLAMRLVQLEVSVDNPDAPAALETRLRVEGVFQPSKTGVAERAARGASEPRSARRQDGP